MLPDIDPTIDPRTENKLLMQVPCDKRRLLHAYKLARRGFFRRLASNFENNFDSYEQGDRPIISYTHSIKKIQDQGDQHVV